MSRMQRFEEPQFGQQLCYITMVCSCHKAYNDKNNSLLTSTNQCLIVITAAYAYPTQPAQTVAFTYERHTPQQKMLRGPIKSAERPTIGRNPQFADQ